MKVVRELLGRGWYHKNGGCEERDAVKYFKKLSLLRMADTREVKAKLFQKFKSTGIESSLKAQLRLQLINLLKSHTNALDISKSPSLLESAVNSLFIDYLQTYDYHYTLAVFVPECSVGQKHLGREDIYRILSVDKSSIERLKSKSEIRSANACVLIELLVMLKDVLGSFSTLDKGCQTDAPKESLDKKLQNLDEELLQLANREHIYPSKTAEERLNRFRKEIEEEYRTQLTEQVEGQSFVTNQPR